MLMDYLYSFVLTLSAHLMLLLMLQGTRTICSSDVSPHYWETPYSQPYFDNSSRREVTATVGQAALLHCRVRNLGDRAVSWIRKRDLHILTVGILTYTNDQRFQSLHTEGSDEWTLRISSPQPRDSGTYECQVSTEPKISQGFRLHVVVSRAKILGNTELFIKSGSNINLTCLATQSPVPPSFIYWYKGKRVMNYSQRGGIQVITERSTRTSKLLIEKATPADSGNYTCTPSNSGSASVMVHVINGEQPAAMQHGNSSAISFLIFHGQGQTWRQIVLLLLTQQTVLTLLHRFIYGAFGGGDDGGAGSDTGVAVAGPKARGRSSWSTRRNTANSTNKSPTSECSSIAAASLVTTGVTMAMCFRTLVRRLLEVKIIKWPANVLHAFGQDPQRQHQRQSNTVPLHLQEGDSQSLRLLKLCSNDCIR